MRTRLLGATLLLLAVAAASCGRSDNEPAFARVSVGLSRAKAPLGSPVEMTYEFTPLAGAAPTRQPHTVFVHFLDADGELMWTDDHLPPVPTPSWKPGETVRYSRTLFLPIFPYVGEATVEVGLYDTGSGVRRRLEGTDNGQRGYQLAKLEILPQTENIFLIYKEGWQPAEVAPDNATLTWQWTRKEAGITFRNPKRDVWLYLHVDGQPPLLTEPQTATVRVGDQVVDTFPVAGKGEIIRRIRIGAGQMGVADTVDLKLGVDRSFVPAQVAPDKSKDARELGLRVYHAFIEPA